MYENVEVEINRGLPEWAESVCVQRLSLDLRGDRHTGKAKLHRTSLKLGGATLGVEHRRVCKPDKSTWIIALRLVKMIVDQSARHYIRLIKSRAAGQYGHVDAGAIHHHYAGR